MKVLVINGPNMNMIGIREKDIYGEKTYHEMVGYIERNGERLGIEVESFQSNHEGDIIDKIHEAYGVFDGMVINAAGYTHTSIAIMDAIKAVSIPTVEVHLTDIMGREDFRKISYPGLACIKSIYGHGFEGYVEALEILKEEVEK